MQGQRLFEYAILRIMPRVEREEFCNVGVVLYSREAKFLQCRYHLDPVRLKALFRELDLHEVEAYLQSFELICRGAKNGGPIAQLDLASRFRWLTATRSTILQCSKVHPGFCAVPDKALEKLVEQLVL
ncbi:DUF3037 domain-containing protein [Flavihumibacter sp. CACIAM 22H1]|uniref:DUF3037 domain-containing protein n=1 Tax=Flavihumibacter sp. CACIAM 22H1 TaxID=1812911 RepID=UPI0007A8F957|nr:DUF3037 domain-containing protein [Flavihumibacter sp. CACIAM 22H1]KYP13871.1 MAG: hypothetical protein A1D16_14745 [Flavihumibacter sp. CACIAM 22H1]